MCGAGVGGGTGAGAGAGTDVHWTLSNPQEYFYGGGGIESCSPGTTQLGQPLKVEQVILLVLVVLVQARSLW